MRKGYGWFLVAITTLGVLAFAYAAPKRTFGKPSSSAKIDDKDVVEASGITPSRRYRSEFYTHNDSGDKARIFRFDEKGKVTAEISLEGAKAIDYEDIDSALIAGKQWVYVADVGDNGKVRKSVTVYQLQEPKGKGKLSVRPDLVLDITYPDGPQNVEAFMVHPKTGDFWIVSKVNSGKSNVYTLPRPNKSGAFQMTKVGTVQVGTMIPGSAMVTAGAFSPDGSYLTLRTYTALFEFRVPKTTRDWVKGEATRIESALENQGEAVCYTLDGKALLTITEGKNPAIQRIKIGS